MMIRRKLYKHFDIIRQCGLFTEVIVLYNHIVKKDYSDFALSLARHKYFSKLPKENYEKELERWYYIQTGHTLNLADPCRFTEKIQWIKLYGMGDKETLLADKFLVREWITDKIGGEFLIPIYGVWDDFNDISMESLPDSFVLKGNHGSHMNYVVNDKRTINYQEIKNEVDRWTHTNYAFAKGGFEMQYLNIRPQIIAEKLMINGDGTEIKDFKFHCFGGNPIFCEVIGDRKQKETIDYYDMEWNHQNFIDEPEYSIIKNSKTGHSKPVCFEEMKRIARILSGEFCYVRVDLYEIDEKVYFGEMTFTPAGGADIFTPDSADYMLGNLLVLPSINKKMECSVG